MRRIFELVKKLEKRAESGIDEAYDELSWIRWSMLEDFKRDLAKNAKAGKHASPPPIRTLFEMADFVVPLLLWLSEHQPENIKKYARIRWAWPGYFHLLKREQARFQRLLPVFNKTGNKIIKESPIDLGAGLGLNLNANRTMGGYIFLLAANSIRRVVQYEEEGKFLPNWQWLRAHSKTLSTKKAKAFVAAANKFFASIGKFDRQNWKNWKPVFDTFLTWHFAPPRIKFRILPKHYQSNLHIALTTGTHAEWFANFKKLKALNVTENEEWKSYLKTQAAFYDTKPLQEWDNRDVQDVVSRKKTEIGKWNELKKEILKRIYKLSPV